MFESDGQGIRLNPNQVLSLQVRGDHTITIKAHGYLDATTTQVITDARINTDECTTLTGPVKGQSYISGQPLPEIKLQLRDKYGNPLIDGPDAGITFTAEIPPGYGGGCTLSGTLTAAADANGQVTFENIVVNLSDGVQQDSLTLRFVGTNSLGYEVDLYLTDPGTGDWIVFIVT
ncbi:MAG: hypothetical protein SCK57_03130 [Bacillota bacterium]|nr:hypothetical protein [Bacillota bacterium]MDW7676634.1 hypothetical protein [Bacillota bacterium]